MTGRTALVDLLVLAADNQIKASIETLLEVRGDDLGIRKMRFSVVRHPRADPGCRADSVSVVRRYIRQAERLLVVFDHDGCGSSDRPEEIERRVEAELAANGWRGRSKVIVIAPELEAWVWGRSEGALRALGWNGGFPALRNWLAERDRWPPTESKPPDPKEAAELVLSRRDRGLDSRFFKRLAATADFADCRDRAFGELRSTLCAWYPPAPRPNRFRARRDGE